MVRLRQRAADAERRVAGHRLDETTVNGREEWVARSPENGSPALFRELWLEGKRLYRARWPKHGTLEVAALTEKPKPVDWFHGSTSSVTPTLTSRPGRPSATAR